MYEMLTGRVPFEGDNSLAVMAGHMQGNPKPLRKLRPEVPAALEAVVLHAMRRYPEHRYPSAAELLDDLDHLDTLDPVAVRHRARAADGGHGRAPTRPSGSGRGPRCSRSASSVCVAVIVTLSVVLR